MRQAFADGVDIHAMTASEMFSVPVEGMPSEVRRRAKAINFGIIYGISAFGLSNQLSIPREEASDYIKRYFERFPGIRDYIEESKEFARQNGYVETIFGRRVHYPEIRSSNPSIRAFNERASTNARLQGTAADIIRRAMIRIEPALDKAGLSARMLLQVHDELIFEAAEGEVENVDPGDPRGHGECGDAGARAIGAAACRRARRQQLGRGALNGASASGRDRGAFAAGAAELDYRLLGHEAGRADPLVETLADQSRRRIR